MIKLQLDSAQWVVVIVALIGIIAPLVTIAANIFEKYLTKRYENQKYKHELYHALIEEIVANKKQYAECQIADIYELRRFRNNRRATINVLQSFYNVNRQKFEGENSVIGKVVKRTIKNVSNPFPIVWRFLDKE